LAIWVCGIYLKICCCQYKYKLIWFCQSIHLYKKLCLESSACLMFTWSFSSMAD
jgi:hypothetical protein